MKHKNTLKAPIEALTRNRIVAGAAVVAGLMLSACGGSSPDTSGSSSDKPPAPAPKQADPTATSLNQYRDDVYYRRQASVALNTCAAWGNVSGGITVVQNPGVAFMPLAPTWSKDRAFFVFSVPDTDGKPPLVQQMNGPEAHVDGKNRVYGGGPWGTILTVDLEKSHSPYAYVTDEPLSRHPAHDRNGQVFYSDTKNDEPVMNTAITAGPFTMDRVNRVCTELAHHQPVTPVQP